MKRELTSEIDLSWLKASVKQGKSATVRTLNAWLATPDESIDMSLSKKQAALGSSSLHPQEALRRLKLEQLFPNAILTLRRQAVLLTDKLTVYMVIATVVGARLGHYVFYERPSDYLHQPMELLTIFRMRGLASHGAAIGIVLALALFAYRNRAKLRGMTWLQLLDFVCVPTALAAVFIRVGNFFNQEILGVPSSEPWAVIYGHAADGSFPVPRHPVQLYEAVAYGVIFLLLWKASFSAKYLLGKGKLLGWFLVLVFGARFVIEHWKEEQSLIMPDLLGLTMGQLLSVPAVLIGVCLLLYSCRRKLAVR